MSETPKRGSVMKGVGLSFGFLIAVGFMGAFWGSMSPNLVGSVLLIPLLGIGLAQLLWIVPAIGYFRKRQETETAKGLAIGAGIIALLNAACWGAMFTMIG